MAVVPSASAAPARPAGGARGLAAGNPWGQAQEVPGIAALNMGEYAEIASVSCASAGSCSAGGAYLDGSDVAQAFVVSEVNGTWRKAEEVPGTAALSNGRGAQVNSVSCGSAGNCSAGGDYVSGYRPSGRKIFQAFVVSEVHGTWRKAEEVPGTAALNKRGDAAVTSVSCGSAGNCSAGGYYASGHHPAGGAIIRAFVVSEVHGTWRKAEEVPGTAALNKGGVAQTTSVSCASAGNCSAVGWYSGAGVSSIEQVFVVSEVHGRWRKAEEVPGTAALNKGGVAQITSVSCASAGNCSAGGSYLGAGVSGNQQAFVVSEVHGTWRKAEEVPGIAALTPSKFAWIVSVSCGAAGNCSAVGQYIVPHAGAFVVSEVHGRWRKAEEVPGTAALSGDLAEITSVSCASAGSCSAGGNGFVVSEVNGTWRKAEEVPGAAALGAAAITSVSCASAGHCSAGGNYRAGPGTDEAFVVSRK
jgi:hypothetical protein